MAEHAPAPKDTLFRDAAIVVTALVLMYVSTNITPVSLETVASGEMMSNLFSFIGIDARLTTVQNIVLSLQNTLAVFGIIFLAGAFWATLKIREIHHAEHEKYEPVHHEKIVEKQAIAQWQVILDHVNSENPAEWKLAILEADNILNEVLEDQGYLGSTVADKLKTMSSTRISSYDEVWNAHRLRNQIAHGGAIDMDLTQKMARNAVSQFGNAFKELGYL